MGGGGRRRTNLEVFEVKSGVGGLSYLVVARGVTGLREIEMNLGGGARDERGGSIPLRSGS